MSRHTLLVAVAVAAMSLSSCSVVADVVSEETDPPPESSAEELLLDPRSVPVGDSWSPIDTDKLESAVADHPLEEVTIEPADCAEAALVTRGPDGAETDFAGLSGASSDDTGAPVLTVITGGRSVEDLREAREECDDLTARAGDFTMTHEEEVFDGPEVSGADASFILEGEYDTTTERSTNSASRYGVVASVRDTLVVVMVNAAPVEDSDEYEAQPISEDAKAEAIEIVEAQVTRIEGAN